MGVDGRPDLQMVRLVVSEKYIIREGSAVVRTCFVLLVSRCARVRVRVTHST